MGLLLGPRGAPSHRPISWTRRPMTVTCSSPSVIAILPPIATSSSTMPPTSLPRSSSITSLSRSPLFSLGRSPHPHQSDPSASPLTSPTATTSVVRDPSIHPSPSNSSIHSSSTLPLSTTATNYTVEIRHATTMSLVQQVHLPGVQWVAAPPLDSRQHRYGEVVVVASLKTIWILEALPVVEQLHELSHTHQYVDALALLEPVQSMTEEELVNKHLIMYNFYTIIVYDPFLIFI